MKSNDLRNQRLETLGTLCAGAMHNLNNCFAVIIASVDMLRRTGPRTDTNMLDGIEKAAKRGSEMVSQLLAFARGSNGAAFRPTSVESLILDLEAVLKSLFQSNIRLEISVSTATMPVQCDENQILQVLLNLCSNARDAMPNGGVLAVTAHDDGDMVQFTVHDDGAGIPPDVLPHIFEPFFTTKEGTGTGIGLSTVKAIVDSHGGSISVESGTSGTVFHVNIPVAREDPKPTGKFNGRGKVVLFVDDEEVLRNLGQWLLIDANYRVLLAKNGPTALTMIQMHDVDVVITDLAMPLMTGQQLMASIRGLGNNVPVIYMTGFDSQLLREPVPAASVQKPFTGDEMLTVLQRVLEDKDRATVEVKVKE